MANRKKNEADRSDRTEIITLKVTAKEKALIEKYAEKDDCTVAQYLRGLAFFDMFTRGDTEVIKMISGKMLQGLSEKIKSMVGFKVLDLEDTLEAKK